MTYIHLFKMQDIEDLGNLEVRRESYSLPSYIFNTISSGLKTLFVGKPETTIPEGIPRTQLIYVKTWGCSHNNSDGEYMAGLLAEAGYSLATEDNYKDADLWVLNGCTVKNPSEESFRNMIKAANEKSIQLVLAGCVPQADAKNRLYQEFSLIGINQLDRIVEIVEETLKGNQIQLLKRTYKQGGNQLDLPKIRKNKLIEILPINTGCLNNCTYCKTKAARGNLRSYPIKEIVDRVKQVVKEGVVEIWMSSEDTGTYGRDLGVKLPELLREVLNFLGQEAPHVMVRLGMTNPPYILDCIGEIADLFHHPNLYAFLHIPIQSGNNKVLHQMRRKYTVEDFQFLVDLLMDVHPDIHIATDIICGFPNETDQEFQDTIEVLKKYKMITVNISQFYPRKGTPAAEAPQIDSKVKKARSREAAEYIASYSPYSQYMGKRFKVLCTELAHHGDYYVAHNKFYHQILIPNREEYMGRSLEVEITEVGRYFMKGRPIS